MIPFVRLHGLVAVSLWLCFSPAALAINLDWDDGGVGKNWSSTFNWNPNQSPTGNDLFIGTLPAAANDSTIINLDFTIDSLSLLAGADADTTGNLLVINGDLSIQDAGSSFVVSEHGGGATTTALELHNATIAAGSTLRLAGGTAVLAVPGAGDANSGDVVILTGGAFSGYGTFRFDDNLAGDAETQLVNSGTLQTGRDTGASLTDRFTLTVESTDPDDTIFDLDGTTESGVVNIDRMTTLQLDAILESFGGTLNFDPGSILDLGKVWTTNDTGVVNVNAESAIPGIPDTARVQNRLFNLEDDAVLNVNSGTLILEQGIDAGSSTTINVAAGGGLQLDGTSVLGSTIRGDLNLVGTGIRLTVNNDLDILDNIFDWDGSEDAVTTINTDARLLISATNISPSAVDDSYDGVINIKGGRLSPSISGGWIFSGTMNLDASTGDVLIDDFSQNAITVNGGEINAIGGTSEIDVPVTFGAGSDTSTSVDAGSTLRLRRDVTFQGGSKHVGDGDVEFHGDITINGDLTIDMPGGDVSLDQLNFVVTSLSLNADLTVNAASLSLNNQFGHSSDATRDLLFINNSTSTLTINLTNPDDEWTLDHGSFVDIRGGAAPSASIAGSDLNVGGEILITDSTAFNARIDVGSTGLIRINTTGEELRLSGGNSADPNTINGGTINGPGRLNTNGTASLEGFGTIGADIFFVGSSDLLADNGTLILNGTVLDADTLGTADNGSTLEINTSLNTANIAELRLKGGTVNAGAIQNNGTTSGVGTINVTSFVNNGSLAAIPSAGVPSTLILQSAGSVDLDGNGLSGQIVATQASITVASPLTDDFGGTATVGSFRRLNFASGWTLGTNGTLNLNGGTTAVSRATLDGGPTVLRGAVNVDRQARIQADTTVRSDATVNLPDTNDVLEFTGDSTIRAGATFTGDGIVNVGATGNLTLQGGLDLTASLANNANLHLDGRAEVFTYDQLASGNLFIDIAGTDSKDFDQLTAEAIANIGGELHVALFGGFMPMENDSFPILTVTGGAVNGQFSTLPGDLPALSGGLAWEIEYQQSAVVLNVIASGLPGDFNNNGVADAADYAVWLAALGSSDETLINNNGDGGGVTISDYNLWKSSFGNTSGAAAASPSSAEAPEPTSVLLLVIGAALLVSRSPRFPQP